MPQLVKISWGTHIFAIDVSRALCQLNLHPVDYDLWLLYCIDSQLLFGTRLGRPSFQRASDAVRYVMHQCGFLIINYTDGFFGYGMPAPT